MQEPTSSATCPVITVRRRAGGDVSPTEEALPQRGRPRRSSHRRPPSRYLRPGRPRLRRGGGRPTRLGRPTTPPPRRPPAQKSPPPPWGVGPRAPRGGGR